MEQQMKGACPDCTWCHGRGCMGCDEAWRRYEKRIKEPIFTADRSNPADMEALNRVFGADALIEALGPGGGGMREIEYNAAVESLAQAIRKSRPNQEDEKGGTDELA